MILDKLEIYPKPFLLRFGEKGKTLSSLAWTIYYKKPTQIIVVEHLIIFVCLR
jgi:hypothetical protein